MSKFKFLKSKVFWICALFLLVLVFGIILLYNLYNQIKDDVTNPDEPVVDVEVTNIERDFNGYILYTDSTDYQRELFTSFEESYTLAFETEGGIPNLEAYIDVYSQNFLADYLTLSVKDIKVKRFGGSQFVHEALRERYIESDGVQDYYNSRDYYLIEFGEEATVKLPEITNLELTSITPTTFNFFDESGVIPPREGLETYELTYNIEYSNNEAIGKFNYYTSVTVRVVGWDGVWTVMDVQFL